MISKRAFGLAGAALVALAPAGAGAVVLDDYGVYGDSVYIAQATNVTPFAMVTGTNGNILGGSRDIYAQVLIAKLNPADNEWAAGTIKNGWWGALNTTTLTFSIDQAAEVKFGAIYDGAGVGPSAAGLNVDLAALGSKISLGYVLNQFIDASAPVQSLGGYASTDIWVTLTDTAGQTASVMARMNPQVYGAFLSLDYAFSDFEAANANLDLTSIFSIEYGGTVRHEVWSTGSLAFSGANFGGSVYTPINAPGGVPEPASWALMIGGLAAAGGLMRRRQVMLATA